ncbi:MAG: sigma-70 family RNA polymerase sigma factor [Actinomycetota bacterium]
MTHDPLAHPEAPDEVGPDELHVRTERRVDLGRAAAQLDQRDRELVALRYGADLTAKQIGEVTGLKTNAVEVALHRALGRLRDLLDENRAVDESASESSPRDRVA